ISLGPSVAPWPVETSTVHDISSSFWAMLGFAVNAATGDTFLTATLFASSGPWFNFYSATILSNVFIYCSCTFICKTRILCSQKKSDSLLSDPEPLLYVVKQVPSDYKSIVYRTRADLLLRVDLLKPTRSSAMVTPSTSHSLLLTMTILSSIDSLVEDPSTNRDFTCAKSPSSICLKALMEPLSICSIYLFVALENVLFYVLNFGSFDASFSLYLVLLE
ncbi:unnamed protein product, partial [Arabidopsis halleri]